MRKIIVGDVNLNILNLVELLDLSDVEVKGRFNCTTNYLTSLKGSPHTAREFMCTGNLLLVDRIQLNGIIGVVLLR